MTDVLIQGGHNSTGKGMVVWERSEKAAICKPRREASEKPNMSTPDLRLKKTPKLYEFILYQPVCGILLRWPQQTSTDVQAQIRVTNLARG
jgi:hypothetical protein